MSSKKAPHFSSPSRRADVPEPKLTRNLKPKSLMVMSQKELGELITSRENLVDIYRGMDRNVAQGDVDKLRQYYRERFGEEYGWDSSGDSIEDAFADLNLDSDISVDDTIPELPPFPKVIVDEELNFELDESGVIDVSLADSQSIQGKALDLDSIVDFKGEAMRLDDLSDDVIYTLQELEKERFDMDEDQYDFLYQLVMSGQMLTQRPEDQDPYSMQAKMDAARQRDEKNKKKNCLRFFLEHDESPRAARRKITAFQEMLEEGKMETVGPFNLLKRDHKIWIVLDKEGGAQLKEDDVPLWIQMVRGVKGNGTLKTSEEIRSAGGKNLLSEIKELPREDELLVKGSVSEVARRITQEIESAGDLFLQKENEELDSYQMRLQETKDAVEQGGFQIPYLEAFVDLGGKIGEEDQFGMRSVEYKGKFNFIDRNNMSVYPSSFDDWFSEVGTFNLQILNTGLNLKSLVVIVRHEGELKFLESDGTLYGLDEQKILINDVKTFDKVGIEDSYGMRWLEWHGHYNFIDSKNRILNSGEWFDEVHPFRPILLSQIKDSGKKRLVALVKTGDHLYFFDSGGQLHKPSIEEIENYFKEGEINESEIWHDISIASEPEVPQLVYIDTLSRRLKALSKKYQDNPERFQAFSQLADEIEELKKNEDAKLDWGVALLIAKQKIQSSNLLASDKRHFLFELNSVAMAANVQSDEFTQSQIDRYKWRECGSFEKGMVVSLELDEGIKYTLTDFDGNLIYREGQFFDYIGPFTGDLAIVRKMGKYNFISRKDGKLIIEGRWFDEAHEFHAGLSRVRVGDRWNFMHSRDYLISEKGYENAKDFNNKTGQAQVYIMGEWINISRKGERMMSVTTRMFTRYQRTKKEGGIPSVLNLREGGVEVPKLVLPLHNRIHKVFSDLLDEFPKEAFEITQLFAYFQNDLNKEIKTIPNGGRVNIVTLNAHLNSWINRFKLPDGLRRRLKYFIMRLNEGDFQSKEIEKLPVSFLIVYKKVLEGCSNQEEEMLLMLLRRMELKIGRTNCLDRKEALNIAMKMEELIKASELGAKTKRRVRHLMWAIVNNDGVYFEGRGSIVEHNPRTPLAKQSQKIIKKVTQKDPGRLIGNPIRHFRKACEFAELGEWRQAKELYEKIMERWSDYKFKHFKLATLLNECFNKNRVALRRGSEKSNNVLKGELLEIREFMLKVYLAAQKNQPKNADIYFNLGLIKEDIAATRDNWFRKLFVVQEGQKEARNYFQQAAALRPGSQEILEKGKNASWKIFGRRFRLAVLLTLGLSVAAVNTYEPAKEILQKLEQSQYNPFNKEDK